MNNHAILATFSDEQILAESRRRNLDTTLVNELRDCVEEALTLHEDLIASDYNDATIKHARKETNAIRERAGLAPK